MKIHEFDIANIRGLNPLYDVVKDYADAEVIPADTLDGRCPFCSKTGFQVTVRTVDKPASQQYYPPDTFECTSCGQAGDLYGFVMQVCGETFNEAVSGLAMRIKYPITWVR